MVTSDDLVNLVDDQPDPDCRDAEGLFMMKKGQVEVTFHWVYILIAGAIILLFFVGLVIKQKSVSEERLGEDVVRILESIVVGAGVSEKTKNFIDTSGLAEYIFEFKCDQGYAGFGIKGGKFEELPIDPVFAPKEIKTSRMIFWSLPYKLPYKVMDLLIITSANTQYIVVGSGSFYTELQNATEGLNFDFVPNLNNISPGKNFHVRIVDVVGNNIVSLPGALKSFGDEQVSAVSFSGTQQVTYYEKKGNSWEKGETLSLVSLGGEKDSARYAAIFAGDGESYKCNMEKVFQRMKYINEVYVGKVEEINKYYDSAVSSTADPQTSARIQSCQLTLTGTDGVNQVLSTEMFSELNKCADIGYDTCNELPSRAQDMMLLNQQLQTGACIQVY
ncbi:MAG: hypothetical protein ABIA37_04080 [Candidatus Woesearchaeota archaeon]